MPAMDWHTHRRPHLNRAPAWRSVHPVARVHISDAHQDRRADECAPLFPETCLRCGTSTVLCIPSNDTWLCASVRCEMDEATMSAGVICSANRFSYGEL